MDAIVGFVTIKYSAQLLSFDKELIEKFNLTNHK